MSDLVLRGGEVVFPDKSPQKQDILVQGGKVKALLAPGAAAPAGTPEQSLPLLRPGP